MTVTGTVTEWTWSNPHCLLEFDVKDDKGGSVHWVAEVSNPPDMTARGWSRKMFKAGDEVTVTMVAAKNGEPIGRIARITVNGKTYQGRARCQEKLNSEPLGGVDGGVLVPAGGEWADAGARHFRNLAAHAGARGHSAKRSF